MGFSSYGSNVPNKLYLDQLKQQLSEAREESKRVGFESVRDTVNNIKDQLFRCKNDPDPELRSRANKLYTEAENLLNNG